MDPRYAIADTREIVTPAFVIFHEILVSNLAEMVRIAGSAARLRPHCKTHKMREVIELELTAGITRHKCATLAEAEMLARAGVKDVFLAYNIVGANIARVAKFVQAFPDVRLAVTADHPRPVEELGRALAAAPRPAGRPVPVRSGSDTGVGAGSRAGPVRYRARGGCVEAVVLAHSDSK